MKTEKLNYKKRIKKAALLFGLIGTIILQSCTREQVVVQNTVDNDTISEVFDLRNINLVFDNVTGEYSYSEELNPEIFPTDVVLVYRMSGLINASTPIWQLIPRTLYLDGGDELDYDYDFSRKDFKIYARGNYNLALTPDYIFNQTFRVVIVPGYDNTFNKSAKNSKNRLDFNDYNAVIKYYNIDESKIKSIN